MGFRKNPNIEASEDEITAGLADVRLRDYDYYGDVGKSYMGQEESTCRKLAFYKNKLMCLERKTAGTTWKLEPKANELTLTVLFSATCVRFRIYLVRLVSEFYDKPMNSL